MSFLDNFSFAFLPMIWKKKTWEMNEYNEMIVENIEEIPIKGVILEKGDFKNIKINNNVYFTEKEYQLRVNNSYQIKKGDEIVVGDNVFDVEFVDLVYIDGVIDHIKANLKLKS